MAVELLQADSAAWGSLDLAAEAERVAALRSPSSVERTEPEVTAPAKPSTPEALLGATPATAVVVGAGPAGLLAAAFLAFHHGCTVHVYDRRGHPGPIPTPPGAEDDNDRAFAVSMNSRGMAAVEAAGLSADALVATPGADMAYVRDQAIVQGDRLPTADGKHAGAMLVARGSRPRVLGSRQAFVRGLLHLIEREQLRRQAAGKAGGSIQFHFGVAFEGADLAAKVASFKSEGSGESMSQGYGLLVGADGFWSRVRRAAAAQDPALSVTTTPANRQYKVVHRLPPLPHLSLWPNPGAKSGSSESYGLLMMVKEAQAAMEAAGDGLPGTIFFSQPTPDAVTAVLTWPHARWAAAGVHDSLEDGAGPEVYARLLAASFPSLPDVWAKEMAAQLATRPLHETGMQVHASQLHAQGVVLLGDAAHAVSPATSNGMNAALEDAWVLSQALHACGGDLAALPQRFTAARLEDVQALLWLDAALSSVGGREAGPSGDAARGRATRVAVVTRVLLGKLTGGLVQPHALMLLKDGTLPYAQAKRQVERDAAVAGVAVACAAPALVLGTALAAGAALVRGGAK